MVFKRQPIHRYSMLSRVILQRSRDKRLREKEPRYPKDVWRSIIQPILYKRNSIVQIYYPRSQRFQRQESFSRPPKYFINLEGLFQDFWLYIFDCPMKPLTSFPFYHPPKPLTLKPSRNLYTHKNYIAGTQLSYNELASDSSSSDMTTSPLRAFLTFTKETVMTCSKRLYLMTS